MPARSTRDAYDRWHTSRAGAEEPQATAPWHELAKRHLGPVAGLCVLEIGCGSGAFAKYLGEQGAHVVGADFSPHAVGLAHEIVGDLARIIVADIQEIPFDDGDFDLVVSLETLEHVPDPDRALAELVRVTKPGGRLVITTPNYLNFVGIYRLARRLVGKPFAECGQPINQPLILLRRVQKLKKLGCRVDAVDGWGHFLPIPRRGTYHLSRLEGRSLAVWFALHGLTVATRL